MPDVCPFHSGIEKDIKALWKFIDEKEKKADLQLNSIRNSIDVAKAEMDRRLEGMNEFRAQLEKQTTTFASHGEVNLRLIAMDEKIRQIEHCVDTITGASRWSDHLITAMIAVAVFLIGWVITGGLTK